MYAIRSYYVAIVAVRQVGGVEQLKSSLGETNWVFDFMPSLQHSDTEQVATGGILKMSRITSYNVCYTKLLRFFQSLGRPF